MEVQSSLLAANRASPVQSGGLSLAEDVETESVPVDTSETEERIAGGFFVSPLLRFDSEALAVLFQVRDSVSGEVTRQFPRESVVEELRQTRSSTEEELQTVETAESGDDAAPEVELATGPSPSGDSEAPPVVSGSSSGTSNGAPIVAASSAPAEGLTPTRSVNLLV